MRTAKSKQDILSKLPEDPENHAFDPARTQAFAECVEWLEERRRQVGIEPTGEEFQEILAAAHEHRDFLNDRWCAGTEEEFRESLRKYARALAQEMLRVHRARSAKEPPATQESLENA